MVSSVIVSDRVAGTVQTRYRVLGKGQLKEKAGFEVSKGLTLPFAPPWPGRGYPFKYIDISESCIFKRHLSHRQLRRGNVKCLLFISISD